MDKADDEDEDEEEEDEEADEEPFNLDGKRRFKLGKGSMG